MRKMLIVLIIAAMVGFQLFITFGICHAESEIITVQLIQPVIVQVPGMDPDEVYSIIVEEDSFTRSFLRCRPMAKAKYGERMIIPFTNIRAIVYGSNYLLKEVTVK